MSAFDFFLLFVLTSLASVFVCYLGWLLFLPLRQLVKQVRTLSRIRSAAHRLVLVDSLLAQQKPLQALEALKKAVFTNSATSAAAIEALKEHHQNILSRCLVISEELGARPENLAEVESLLLEHSELQVLLIRVTESYRGMKFRRQKEGKAMPKWSKNEFEQRIAQIRNEIARNSQSLDEALDVLFASLAQGPRETVTYH